MSSLEKPSALNIHQGDTQMRKSNTRKVEIRALQDALARAQVAIAEANKNTNKVREEYQKELTKRDEQLAKWQQEAAAQSEPANG